MGGYQEQVDAFLEQWPESEEGNRRGFLRLYTLLQEQEQSVKEVQVAFYPRPGVTYSLRGELAGAGDTPGLYVMIDVIEDDPRWLSICFYGGTISDPEEKGAFVPGGLLGEDALCFDLERYDDGELAYVESRIREACRAATAG